MASLTDSPGLVGSRQGARRDFGLLNRAYRMAKRKGDFAKALEYARMGDQMGIPVGRPAAMEEIEGVGEDRYNRSFEVAGQAPPKSGLAGFDFSHSRDGGPGVGGYDFNQTRNPRLSAFARGVESEFDQRTGLTADPGMMESTMPMDDSDGFQVADTSGNTNSGSIGGYDFSPRRRRRSLTSAY